VTRKRRKPRLPLVAPAQRRRRPQRRQESYRIPPDWPEENTAEDWELRERRLRVPRWKYVYQQITGWTALHGFVDGHSLWHFLEWGAVSFVVTLVGDISLAAALALALATWLRWALLEKRQEPCPAPWFNRWVSTPIVDVCGGLVGWWLAHRL